MVTFNVDSLDFEDDEEARFGADADFATRFDSGNSRLELEDLTNATVGYVPQNRAGDLIDGRLAETLDEGKVLVDDGNVYDTLSTAVNNMSSWAKMGPGTFDGDVTIDDTGATLVGSGYNTQIISNGNGIGILAERVTIANMYMNTADTAIQSEGNSQGSAVINVQADVGNRFVSTYDGAQHYKDWLIKNNTVTGGSRTIDGGPRAVIVNNTFSDVQSNEAIYLGADDDSVAAYNRIENCNSIGIDIPSNDSVVLGNRIHNCSGDGILARGNDIIVANNRVSNCNPNISSSGSGNVLDANATGPIN